jgi:hypothetical protein
VTRLFFILIGFAVFAACNETAGKNSNTESVMEDSTKFTTIQWQDSVIDFGTRKMGDIVNIIFVCTNTGDRPLYLSEVRPGCGCTLVDYTKQPIKPGEQGKIEAKFDTNKSRPGTVHKNVYVHTNTFNDSKIYLGFTGTVTAVASAKQ